MLTISHFYIIYFTAEYSFEIAAYAMRRAAVSTRKNVCIVRGAFGFPAVSGDRSFLDWAQQAIFRERDEKILALSREREEQLASMSDLQVRKLISVQFGAVVL